MPRHATRSPRDLLTPAALHILLTLSQGERHGLGIKAAVEERTGGRLRLGPGTLYEAVHRMHDDGWIEELEASGRRRVYTLTPEGRTVLRDELARLRDIVEFARSADLIEGET